MKEPRSRRGMLLRLGRRSHTDAVSVDESRTEVSTRCQESHSDPRANESADAASSLGLVGSPSDQQTNEKERHGSSRQHEMPSCRAVGRRAGREPRKFYEPG